MLWMVQPTRSWSVPSSPDVCQRDARQTSPQRIVTSLSSRSQPRGATPCANHLHT
jgi:hypothetical protein